MGLKTYHWVSRLTACVMIALRCANDMRRCPFLSLSNLAAENSELAAWRMPRDYILELLDAGGFDSWDTKTAADTLELGGYAREELCDGAPLLFKGRSGPPAGAGT